ncbi:metal binding domain of Ada-domain-containing protein [Xylariomycetidae sp. FL2044]|nr:metal binding domain of Ada-domain-containing protein [Xylariomycetidae sp. FL2044]
MSTPYYPYPSDTDRWAAVQTRDPRADGVFVYAVRTTKIYCRTVCKSRRARRANVVFYARARDAERAGYRPCKRCRPEVGGGMPEEAAVARVRRLVRETTCLITTTVTTTGLPEEEEDSSSGDGERKRKSIRSAAEEDNSHSSSEDHHHHHHRRTTTTTTSDLAQRARVSKWHFHRVFKEITGMTPAEYASSSSSSGQKEEEQSSSRDFFYFFSSSSSSMSDRGAAGEEGEGEGDAEIILGNVLLGEQSSSTSAARMGVMPDYSPGGFIQNGDDDGGSLSTMEIDWAALVNDDNALFWSEIGGVEGWSVGEDFA